MIDYKELYEVTLRENLALKKILERTQQRLDDMKQGTQGHTYTGAACGSTGSDYLDCVLGVGGFEQYGPINGDEK